MRKYANDISDAAMEALLKFKWSNEDEWESFISQAILNERERCADIARNAQVPEEAYEAIMMGDA